ncbi:hypothetical protein F5Y08DRAFT_315076 [Xylaria arbuscula]|nr:hypothetical protein F5Y08DRAFT_315076 [Xylaria arbuscula]
MQPVAFFKRPMRSCEISKVLVHCAPVYMMLSLVVTVLTAVILNISSTNEGIASLIPTVFTTTIMIVGLFILVSSVAVMLLTPMLLLDVYRGKFWSTQAHFVGLEGIPSEIGDIERLLFGFNHGRLKWSTVASTLSRSGRSDYGERVGLPLLQSHGLDHDADDEEIVFTLIDTYRYYDGNRVSCYETSDRGTCVRPRRWHCSAPFCAPTTGGIAHSYVRLSSASRRCCWTACSVLIGFALHLVGEGTAGGDMSRHSVLRRFGNMNHLYPCRWTRLP